MDNTEEIKQVLLLEVDININEKSHNVFVLANEKVSAIDQLKLWQAGNVNLIYYKGVDNLKTPSNKLSMGKGLGPLSSYRLIRYYSINEFTEEELQIKQI